MTPTTTARQTQGRNVLNRVRALIRRVAQGDEDRVFYLTRYVFQRLKAGEQQPKHKKQLLKENPSCHFCRQAFEGTEQRGVNVVVHHLTPSTRALAHTRCHQTHHRTPGSTAKKER